MGNISRQIQRFQQRRRYLDILRHIPKKTIEQVWQYSFRSDDYLLGKVLSVPSNLPTLKSCKKSGSWVPNSFPVPRKYRWTSKHLAYFPNFPNLHNSLTVQTNLINSVNLLKISNCSVSRDSSSSNSLNIYQSKLEITGEGKNTENALLLDISGGDSFQHFVQDALPILSLISKGPEFLKAVTILIPKPASSFKSLHSYIEAMNIDNEIRYIEPDSLYFVNNLYLFDFQPFNMMYGLPSELYSDTHRLFNASTNYDSKNKGVLLLERRELSRNFKHSERVSKKISKWAQSQGLTFKSINTSSLGFEDIRRNFQEAKFIFAIHGGANYNIIWAEPKTTFVEFIPTRATDSLASLAISYGLDYLPYALNHDKGDFEFEVKESDLELIFKTLESTHI